MIMGWMMDEYCKIRRQHTPAVITGKPIQLGGSLGRNDATFDVPSLVHHKNVSRRVEAVYCDDSVCQMVEADQIANEELLELDVDVLIPSALENAITQDNAGRIRAPVVVEVANGPTTGEADRFLDERGTLILPHILANAGGVTVSYFEWVQNKAGYYWTLEEVHEKLRAIMTRDREISMRTAAYVHALNRLGEAIESQGTESYFAGESER